MTDAAKTDAQAVDLAVYSAAVRAGLVRSKDST